MSESKREIEILDHETAIHLIEDLIAQGYIVEAYKFQDGNEVGYHITYWF